MLIFVLGFYNIPVKGKIASKKDAPIFISNHLSAFDGFILGWLLEASPCIRSESEDNPVLGPLYRCVQSIFVQRNKKEARKQVAKEIIYRSTHLEYPQLLIFPEAATTNGKGLMTFKAGAFYPGVSIQPIILRCADNLKWTPGRTEIEIFLRTLAQPYNYLEVEILDPYHPSEEEKKNPEMFCENTRNYMAKKLNAEATDCSYQDAFLVHEARMINPKIELDFTVNEFTKKYGISFEDGRNDFMDAMNAFLAIEKQDLKVTSDKFIKTLEKTGRNKKFRDSEYCKKIWKLVDHENKGILSIKEFFVNFKMLEWRNDSTKVELAFEYFNPDSLLEINLNSFKEAIQGVKLEEGSELYIKDIQDNLPKQLSLDEFKKFVEKFPYVMTIASKGICKWFKP